MEECARGADQKRRHAPKDYRGAYGGILNDEGHAAGHKKYPEVLLQTKTR